MIIIIARVLTTSEVILSPTLYSDNNQYDVAK